MRSALVQKNIRWWLCERPQGRAAQQPVGEIQEKNGESLNRRYDNCSIACAACWAIFDNLADEIASMTATFGQQGSWGLRASVGSTREFVASEHPARDGAHCTRCLVIDPDNQ